MAGIKISKRIKDLLPPEEKEGIDERLWTKSGGKCFLCGVDLNRASDDIVPDHDIPEAEDGPTCFANLNLAHSACNAFKKNYPSVQVRPYLGFKAFFEQNGGLLKYGDCLAYFKIVPKESVVTTKGDEATFEFANGSKNIVPIMSETNGDKITYHFCFVDVPREAMFHDHDVQPRNIKLKQIWAIFADLQINPLHEPPAARLDYADRNKCKLLLFDGQHKSIVSWLMSRDKIPTKIYLELSKDQANQLVNSIQAKIPKLPLSPFELTAKLSQEFQSRLDEFVKEKGGDNVSEASFIKWIPTAQRDRAQQALFAAYMKEITDDDKLDFKNYIDTHGKKLDKKYSIKETTFENKILKKLLYLKPLLESGDVGREMRLRERFNIVQALNVFSKKAFATNGGESPQGKARMNRMLYQGALEYICKEIKGLYRHILSTEDGREFLDKMPTTDQWKKIDEGVQRLIDHDVWTASFEYSKKMRNIELALTKNQNLDSAFSAVGLKVGYLVGADKLDPKPLDDK